MADCTCAKPNHDGLGNCQTCSGFACEYADRGMTRCPSWRCDCFIEQFPDTPRALHPEAFIVLDKHAGEQADVPALSGAREALVEQVAHALFAEESCDKRQRADVQANWDGRLNDQDQEEYRALARAVLPLVEAHAAAVVEAAVSVVRAERDEARAEVRARDDDAAMEVERVKRGARELGRILDRTLNMALDISGRQDAIDADGDGDWGVVWETLAELRPRAESAESERDALREKVARVEALRDEWRADYPGPGASWRGDPDEWWRALDVALSDPRDPWCHGCDPSAPVRNGTCPAHSATHAESQCRPETCGGTTYDPCRAALSDPTTPDQEGGAS